MIRSFADDETLRFFETGRSRRLPPDIQRRASMRLTQLDSSTQVGDLRLPPSNRLESLRHDRAGQWRICFRFEDGDAFDVEIVDYH